MQKKQSGPENLAVYLRQELTAIEAFHRCHAEFCRYYFVQASYMDEQLFTRGSWETALMDQERCIRRN